MAAPNANLKSTRSIIIPFFSGLGGAIVAMIFAALVVYWFTDFKFLHQDSCGNYNGSTFCIFDDRWDTETYLSTISSFYGTVITILIGLLAFVAAFAFFAVRASAMGHAEDRMSEEVHRYFTDSRIGEERIRLILEGMSKVRNQTLANRIDFLETTLSEQGIITLSDLDVEA